VALEELYGSDAAGNQIALTALSRLDEGDIGTVVDLTGRARVESNHAMDRLAAIAGKSLAHIVAGFAYYKDPWLEQAGNRGLDALTDLYIERADDMGNGVKAGIYGEIGTSLDDITPREELHLRAVARAQTKTGLAVSTHCTLGTMGVEQADILISEGADPAKVVVGHLDLAPDIGYLEKVLASGVNIAFDTFGKEWFDYRVPGSEGDGPGEFVKWTYHRPDSDRIATLAELCARSYDDRIVLSCDMSGLETWHNPGTHGKHGYSYLPSVVIPRLEQAGVSLDSVNLMLVENPSRILAIR
jgi:phosphotriesterase-related protein